MKKAGNYLLTAVPLIAGLGIQMICSTLASLIYGIYYGMRAMADGDKGAMTQDAILGGFNSIILYVLILSQLVALLVFGIWYRHQNRGREKKRLTQVVHVKTLGGILFLGIGLQLFTNLFLQIAYMLIPDALEQYAALVETVGIGQANVVSVLATVILAPIVEEIMFRGITFRIAKRAGAGFLLANLIQAGAFGIYHFNLIQGIYAAMLGFVLGYVTEKYDSVYPSVLLHLAYNFAATILSAVAAVLPENAGTQVMIMVVMAATTLQGIWFFYSDRQDAGVKQI